MRLISLAAESGSSATTGRPVERRILEAVMVDYKAKDLCDSLLVENDLNKKRVRYLEKRQTSFEITFRNLRRLRQDLQALQKEAEERNAQIQDFVATFLPELSTQSRSPPPESTKQRVDALSAPVNTRPVAIPAPLPTATASDMPPSLPAVDYSWTDCHHSTSPYLYLSNRITPMFFRGDELKLTLKFNVDDSKRLPTKIQLELRDPHGRLVFHKRQNIYYVVVQEKIATLDGSQDYRLEVTTVTSGIDERSTSLVTIHNKNWQTDESTGDLALATAIQEFVEEVEFLEARPFATVEHRGVQPRATTIPEYELQKTSCVVLKRPSAPPSVKPPSSMQDGKENHINPLSVSKKQTLPEVKYKWQRGYRKALNGRYIKVPILKVALKFDDQLERLPFMYTFHVKALSKSPNHVSAVKATDSSPLSLTSRLSLNQCTCEFQLQENCEYVVHVENRRDEEEVWIVVPPFDFKVKALCDELLGEWTQQQPMT